MDAITQGPINDPAKQGAARRTLLGRTNKDWWPEQISLHILHQRGVSPDPYGDEFDYAKAFLELDYDAVKRDLTALMTDSQPWWPADYGHYGPFFIRMAWHAAGTYRTGDGRGGSSSGGQRFAPLNSWPDNGNLDKARRLLWPIKQKYGRDCRGRTCSSLTATSRSNRWRTERSASGGGTARHLRAAAGPSIGVPRRSGSADIASTMSRAGARKPAGWRDPSWPIYVNAGRARRLPRPIGSGRDMRETFARMGMIDEETVALDRRRTYVGRLTARATPSHVGVVTRRFGHRSQGLGLAQQHESGMGDHTITSGLEGAWTPTPIQWDDTYFHMLLDYEYELVKSPAGSHQWRPVNQAPEDMAPGAHSPERREPTMMSTADMALKLDPEYRKVSRTVPGRPGAIRGRVGAGLVQADASRHGSQDPVFGSGSPGRGPDLAGPDPEGRLRADRHR
jgi:catalase-peroxidase